MLREVAGLLHAQFREYDFLARYAGDEFVAIIPNTTTADVFDLCRRIEAAVSEFSLKFGDREARVGVSIGSAGFPHAGDSFDQLLISADKKMYLKKSVHKRTGQAGLSESTATAAAAQAVALAATKAQEASYPSGAISIVEETELVQVDETHIVSRAVN